MKPRGPGGGPSAPVAPPRPTSRAAKTHDLMEQVVARENMQRALRRVEQNRGAPGVDGVTTEQLKELLIARWVATRAALLGDAYRPQPVRRVEIRSVRVSRTPLFCSLCPKVYVTWRAFRTAACALLPGRKP